MGVMIVGAFMDDYGNSVVPIYLEQYMARYNFFKDTT